MNRATLFTLKITLLFIAALNISCSEREQQRDEKNANSARELEYTGQVYFIASGSDTLSTANVAVADDNRSRNEGLMNVMNLPENTGMLFVFEDEQPRSFWMANTPLSLDILFINSEMEIIRIHRNTQPYSQESIQSEEPAQYVVEVNAGYTLQHDIREGMEIRIEGID